ncbi:peptide chain release factor 1 [Prevotella copri]|jgi:hypothetical protein|uniref:peptide chain release factor 1 n=1 Tax=Segatella TaxID=2974251 RepID=UPI001290F42F|nr:peptide chain release factor 1 [Segatella copri]MQN44208.1 peptide chain release factor 1 [Segatella copri]MQN48791.1 peptide chain release factor 1 [Segatella copri]MQN52583.1 peptide chain release factor 1 [Segatella copri]MQN54188.1 peptide chain release factor 1 [Segatella copri]MQN56510.1 peptide chain release factor 1 [Segatella copri]
MDIDELITQGETLRASLKKVESRLMSWYEYTNHGAFQEWVQKTTRFLHTHYSGDIMIEEFEELASQGPSPKGHDKLLAILKAFKEIPQAITPPKEHHGGIVITNSNSQSQNQQQAANIFLEAISDELTGKQMKELKAALADEKGGKKGSLIEKVKSFGLDTLSNIVANIVTNPAIWG